MEEKIVKGIKSIANVIIVTLMIILLISMILGTLDLIVQFAKAVLSPDPYRFMINVEDLYSVFSVILIIIVGYETLKSMNLLLHHNKIPVKSILQIAMIALANKVITLNIKNVTLDVMIGIAILITSIGVAFFFFSKSSESFE
jgi:uncharacterized membrane protein (DUF373 family)